MVAAHGRTVARFRRRGRTVARFRRSLTGRTLPAARSMVAAFASGADGLPDRLAERSNR